MGPLLVVVLACGQEPGRAVEDVQADPVREELMLIDAGSVGVKWTAAQDWIFGTVTLLGDVTGDGIADAAVGGGVAGETIASAELLLVAGPLRRSLTLPGDEIARFPAAGLEDGAGDPRGDGSVALHLVVGPDRDTYLVEGPFSGTMDPLVVGTPVDRHVVDADGDGILDQIKGVTGEVRITWGPMSRWSGPADVVMQLTCESGDAFPSAHRVAAYPDLDGDGRREVWVDDIANPWCGGWLFPLPSDAGTFVAADDPDAVQGFDDALDIVGDQNGDGVADVWTSWDKTVSAGPIGFAHPSLTASWRTTADADLYSVSPIPFDLDGDGVTDFVALDAEIDASEVEVSAGGPIDPVTGEVLVVVPAAELEHPQFAAAWDIDGRVYRGAFLEDGVVSALVKNDFEIVVVDLGPGAAP